MRFNSTKTLSLVAPFLLASLGCGSDGNASDHVPQAILTATPTDGRAPLTVDFTGEARGGDAPISITWDFGQGESSEGDSVRHSFEIPGDHRVVMRATDRDGDFDEAEVHILVTPGILGVTLQATPVLGLAPLQVSFKGSVAGGTPPYTHQWDFADGSSSALQSPTHNFGVAKDYDVTYSVADSAGKQSSTGVRITATSTPVPLAVSAHATPASGAAPLGVSFSSTINGGSPPYTYNWDFGDGQSDTSAEPVHPYMAAGSFVATLTVGDKAANAKNDSISIEIGAPVRLLINELVYDSTGTPDANCFIELVGDPSASLLGFSLEAVNGETGLVYASLDLSALTVPQDGFLVLAQRSAHPLTLAQTDLQTEFVNLQNGPDSLRIMKGGVVVDALGYGSFTPAQAFVGEGSPAAGVLAEHALGRNAVSQDTDDNAADFKDIVTPTPGVANP